MSSGAKEPFPFSKPCSERLQVVYAELQPFCSIRGCAEDPGVGRESHKFFGLELKMLFSSRCVIGPCIQEGNNLLIARCLLVLFYLCV